MEGKSQTTNPVFCDIRDSECRAQELTTEIDRLRSWLREIGRNPVAPTPAAIEKIIANV